MPARVESNRVESAGRAGSAARPDRLASRGGDTNQTIAAIDASPGRRLSPSADPEGAVVQGQRTLIEPLMTHEPSVARREIEIINSLGLHLRPADKFVKLAIQYRSDVRILYNGGHFNGKSILDLATLAAECGSRMEIEARGDDAEQAVEALAKLVSAGFYEDANGDAIPPPAAPGAPR